MRQALLITTALAMLGGPAFAQNAAQTGGAANNAAAPPAANQSGTSASGAANSAATKPSTAQTNMPAGQTGAANQSGTANQSTLRQAQPVASTQLTFYAVQAADVRASKLMGTDVYNKNNEKIGDVEDLIIDNGKTIKAVVVSVGGFLGIGERNVAVQPGSVMMTEERDGDWRLVVNTTRDDLKNAPAFNLADVDKAGATSGSASADAPAKSSSSNSSSATSSSSMSDKPASTMKK